MNPNEHKIYFDHIGNGGAVWDGVFMMPNISMDPIEATCGTCGGQAFIVPWGNEGKGMCVCPKCTFGDASLTLSGMLQKMFAEKGE